MKLYFTPGACSLSPHIVAHEVGIALKLERVDLRTKLTEHGVDYRTVNSKGYVPALVLVDGTMITEGAVIAQYLADQKLESGVAPAFGSLERYRMMEWLHYIGTELHKGMSPLYGPLSDDARSALMARLANRFDHLASALSNHPFLLGDRFSVADAYAFYALRSYQHVGKASLESAPVLGRYYSELSKRPSVAAALKHEGISA